MLRKSLAALDGQLISTSDAEKLRLKWIEELRPLHKNAFVAKPLGLGRGNEPRRAAIALAKPAGWKSEHVASALVLTGAERMDANRDFKAIKDEVRKAFARVPVSVK